MGTMQFQFIARGSTALDILVFPLYWQMANGSSIAFGAYSSYCGVRGVLRRAAVTLRVFAARSVNGRGSHIAYAHLSIFSNSSIRGCTGVPCPASCSNPVSGT